MTSISAAESSPRSLSSCGKRLSL